MSIPITGYILIALLASVSSLQFPSKHLAINRNYKFTVEYGGGGGDPFHQWQWSHQDLKYIKIRHGEHIDSIQLCFQGGPCTKDYGGNGGREETTWYVPQGQHICTIQYRSGAVVDSLRFITNTGGRSPYFGGNGGIPHTVYIPCSKRIIGLVGRYGKRVDRLGFIYGDPL